MNPLRKTYPFGILYPVMFILLFFCIVSPMQPGEKYIVKGLEQEVEILKDRWGMSHIYAQNQRDLFFAQGFNVARDRLFQLEMWRRKATGTLAEILGHQALKSDTGSRLLRARVDMEQEMRHYHPDGKEIITSFVEGINAYIDWALENPKRLPLEFKLLGIRPGHWTPEVVVSRHNGLFRNTRNEISNTQILKQISPDRLKDIRSFHPGDPKLQIDKTIDSSLISGKILEIYSSSRSSIRFTPSDITDPADRAKSPPPKNKQSIPFLPPLRGQDNFQGSNNWVVSGQLTATGMPFMANDPHRTIQIPSLRYWVHLKAPGWDVIGGGEPALPGISIGHNPFGAWGLTIFAIDQEDLYVYETHPDNPNEYRYRGKWERMDIENTQIPVKGEKPARVELKYTRHGPVIHEDRKNNKAYALRAAWLEIGGAPYLASLRMDQARNWREFREACSYSRTPSENMVWADKGNNIGWQAVGIAPIRPNWEGLLPVPGDGRYEWDGYLPIKSLPHVFNPPKGYIATANQDNIPRGYPYSLGFAWAEGFRFDRAEEFLRSGRKFTLYDMISLQQDVLSIPARSLVPLLKGLKTEDRRIGTALSFLLNWDFRLSQESIEATIYSRFIRRLSTNVWKQVIPKESQKTIRTGSFKKMLARLTAPDGSFGTDPITGRDATLLKSLSEALEEIEELLGPDMKKWQYGQEKYHHNQIRHMLSRAISPALQDKLDTQVIPRGGDSYTVNMTTSGMNQRSGASFRIIADLSDWDNSVGTNAPGQSGDPDSPHYKDLHVMLSRGTYFPIFFTRKKIESVTDLVINLKPIK